MHHEVGKAAQSVLLSILASVGAWLLVHWIKPLNPPLPLPLTPVPAKPDKPHRPLLPWRQGDLPVGKIVPGGSTAPDGKTEVDCDLLAVPGRKPNIASKGLGCCVFRSLDYAARWQNVPALYDFPEWMVKRGIEGGGYPGKVAKLIPQISKDRGLPAPDHVCYEGDSADIIKLALKSGRVACLTYAGADGVHYHGRIAHMLVCCAWNDEADAVGLCDNNWPNEILWLSRAEFLQRWKSDGGWVEVLCAPGPPPAPKN